MQHLGVPCRDGSMRLHPPSSRESSSVYYHVARQRLVYLVFNLFDDLCNGEIKIFIYITCKTTSLFLLSLKLSRSIHMKTDIVTEIAQGNIFHPKIWMV